MHEPETTVEDVAEKLLEEAGAGEVLRQYEFDDERVADIIAFFRLGSIPLTFAVEVENDSGSVLNGGGQARYYAEKARAVWPNTVPVLAVPTGHIDPSERETIEATGVVVWEVPA